MELVMILILGVAGFSLMMGLICAVLVILEERKPKALR